MNSAVNIDSDERSVFDVGELKDSTANGTEVDKGTSERNMHTSYTTSDGGADLQSEASSVPYTANVRVARSRGLNLPQTDPGN